MPLVSLRSAVAVQSSPLTPRLPALERWRTASSATVPLTSGKAGPPPGIKWPQCSCYPKRLGVPSVSVVLGKLHGNTVGTWTVHTQQWHAVGCVFVCVCAPSRRWWAGVQHSGAHMCFSIICRTDFCLSILSVSFSLSLAPSFITTRRPGRRCFWNDSTWELFILGTEVLEAVIWVKQRVFGWGEPAGHQHCQTDETLTPYEKTAIKTGTNEQDVQNEITLIKERMYKLFMMIINIQNK